MKRRQATARQSKRPSDPVRAAAAKLGGQMASAKTIRGPTFQSNSKLIGSLKPPPAVELSSCNFRLPSREPVCKKDPSCCHDENSPHHHLIPRHAGRASSAPRGHWLGSDSSAGSAQ